VYRQDARVTAPQFHEEHRLLCWIELNEQALRAYWLGDLPYTEDLIAALRPV
jgi:hypothetical protein